MKLLFIEDEQVSIEVAYYHDLLGKLVIVTIKVLRGVLKHARIQDYVEEVVEQHIAQLKYNKLEPSKF